MFAAPSSARVEGGFSLEKHSNYPFLEKCYILSAGFIGKNERERSKKT
jgi:hypothetical protein